MNQKNTSNSKTNAVDTESKASTTLATQTAELVQKQSTVNPSETAELVALVRQLTKEVADLKNGKKEEHMMVKAKQIYKWPRKFRCKLYWGVPVVNFISKKIDKNRDYLYKNTKWEFVNNHQVEVSLADGSTVDVDYFEFMRSIEYSEEQFCEIIKKPDGKEYYVFNIEPYGEFQVLASIIN